MSDPSVTRLRLIGFLEGLSWIALIVAMVVKRVQDMPGAVRIPGMVHGLLFVLFCVAVVLAMRARRWSWSRGLALFIASLLPFGTFVMDHRIKRWGAD